MGADPPPHRRTIRRSSEGPRASWPEMRGRTRRIGCLVGTPGGRRAGLRHALSVVANDGLHARARARSRALSSPTPPTPGRRGAGAGAGVHGPLTLPVRSRPRPACLLSIPVRLLPPTPPTPWAVEERERLARRGRPRGRRSGCRVGSKELDRRARRCSLSAIPRARHGVDVSRGAASNSTATSGGSLLPRPGRSSASIAAASRPRTSRLQS